ncbi:MAG: GNAT family N-acetyltransferase [Pseudomonadota bacterium]
MGALTVATLSAGEVRAALPDLARLRISVFRAYPYLYAGDADYEQSYLKAYAESAGAVVVVARDGDLIVGAATAAPLEDHAPEFTAALQAEGYRPETIWYCGESVLLPAYRGQGIGHAFFDAREAAGRAQARVWSAFCAVMRPPDHPARPPDYAPLDPFWRRRGYQPLPGVTAAFDWAEVGGDGAARSHPMQFWIRALT